MRHIEPLRELSTSIRGDIFHDSEERLSAISSTVNSWLDVISEALLFASMSRRCAALGEGEQRDNLMRKVVKEITLSHLIVINGQPSADKMIDTIARTVPVGTQVNIMGIQNIRGPGREMSVKMAAATNAINLTSDLNQLDHEDKIQALTERVEMTEWTIPGCQEVLRSIYALRVPSQMDEKQIALRTLRDRVVERLTSELALLRNQIAETKGLYYRLTSIFSMVFSLVRPIAMIVWRLKADRTMNDLVSGRISHSKAGAKLNYLSNAAKSNRSSSSTSESLI
jgi:hypothetical protein